MVLISKNCKKCRLMCEKQKRRVLYYQSSDLNGDIGRLNSLYIKGVPGLSDQAYRIAIGFLTASEWAVKTPFFKITLAQ